MRRLSLTVLSLIIGLVLGLAPFTAQVAAEQASVDNQKGQDYRVDSDEQSYRVAFPLHDRVFFGAFAGGSTAGPNLRGGLRMGVKHSFGVDYPEEEIWWRFRHSWLTTEVERAGADLHLRSTLIESTYLRHDKSGSIVIPSATDLRFPAPFDLAIEYTLLGVDFDSGRRQFQKIDFARFAFLLDFIRDPDYRHRLALGPVVSYSISRDALDRDSWNHSFIPATGGRILYGWESATGLTAAGTELQCAGEARLIDEGLGWGRRCGLDARLERTLVAVNDRPISLLVTGSVEENPWSDAAPVWSASLGVRLSLPRR